MNINPLIHIGYPKAASSFLQQVLFNNESFGFYKIFDVPSVEALEQFSLINGFEFSVSKCNQVFRAEIIKAVKKSLIPVLSHERLSYDHNLHQYNTKEIANRIYQTFPNALILIVIREQTQMICSLYREYIRNGGTLTIKQFLGDNLQRKGWRKFFELDILEYYYLINYYQKQFGKENILVVPYEFLEKNPEIFFQRILSFVKINNSPILQELNKISHTKVRVGFKLMALSLQRQLNFFCHPPIYGEKPSSRWQLVTKIIPKVDSLCPMIINNKIEENVKNFIVERVGNYYTHSNKITGELIGVDLKSLGYKI